MSLRHRSTHLIGLLICQMQMMLMVSCNLQTENSFSEDDARYSPPAETDETTSTTSDGTTVSSSNPQYFESAKSVLKSHCISCHASFGSYTESQWVTYGYVNAGSSNTSTLFLKIRGSNSGGDENMPPAGSLSGAEVAAVRTWIDSINTSTSTGGGSGGGSSGGSGSGTTLTAAQRTAAAVAVLKNSCGGCHGVVRTAGAGPNNGLTVPAFTTYSADADFVTVGLVSAGDATNSWIYQALKTWGSLNKMPASGAISTTSRDTINTWITRMGQP